LQIKWDYKKIKEQPLETFLLGRSFRIHGLKYVNSVNVQGAAS
jgi:hypothetical protein